jgi:hypothetical protein
LHLSCAAFDRGSNGSRLRLSRLVSRIQNPQISMIDKVASMWEVCPVDLHVSLPKGVAEEVADVQRRDPDMLSRIVIYAVTRRTIFDHLATRTSWPVERQET